MIMGVFLSAFTVVSLAYHPKTVLLQPCKVCNLANQRWLVRNSIL